MCWFLNFFTLLLLCGLFVLQVCVYFVVFCVVHCFFLVGVCLKFLFAFYCLLYWSGFSECMFLVVFGIGFWLLGVGYFFLVFLCLCLFVVWFSSL